MSNSKDMTFLHHLEELRWHLIRSFIAILIFAFLAFLAKEFIFDTIIFGPKRGDFISYDSVQLNYYDLKTLYFFDNNR